MDLVGNLPVPRLPCILDFVKARGTKSWFYCFGREAHEQCSNSKNSRIKD